MRPIRAFLFARGTEDQWICQVFRDFELLLEAATAANGGRQYPVGVHVGFERPDTKAVEDLLSKQEGLVFLSNGAMGTMPLPVRASQIPIGSAGESSFHTALDGFGYQIEQTDEVLPAPLQPMSQVHTQKNTASDWVATLVKLDPTLAYKLNAAGIWDEDSYLRNEADLDIETRYFAGLQRYGILEQEQPNATSFIDKLESAPPWILSAPIKWLSLTVRSSNVCAAHDIRLIRDFAKYGLKGLHKLPSLGEKSVREISGEIVDLFISGHPLKAVETKFEWAIPPNLADSASTSNEESVTNHSKQPGFSKDLSEDMTSGFIEAAQKLTEIERGIWAGRLGFRCEPMTLQQIADLMSVTRERVRQMEVKVYKRVQQHPFWDELSSRINKHLSGRTSPLFLNGLPAIDPWFKDADQLVHALREVSEHIPRLGFHVLTWRDLPVISALSETQWKAAVDEAKSLLMALADLHLNDHDALTQAAGVLIGKAEDMREALVEEVSNFCVWSVLPDGSRILVGFGKSVSALVSSVLQASDSPLHIDEIQRRVSAYSGFEGVSQRNIHGAASEVGILYGRGIYGLMKHCPLNPSQMLTIRAEVEDIIFGGSASKQWHSNELYDELLNRGFGYEDKLTKYIINIALGNSTNLVYLRRMIWGVRGEWDESASARLDVKQAIISLLEEEGKPMSTDQIRSRLIEGRGLNTYFQIWASSPLVRLGPGLWGLEGRDLDMEHARMLAYRLLKELSVRQEGMHVSEVAAFLGLSSEAEVSMLASVANTDGLRMDRGQYFYLQPWGESRRISIWEAATSTLKAHPKGLPKGELQLFVERIARRKVGRQQLSGILQNIDAIYDAESGLWKSTGPSEDDGESDEDFSNSSYDS
jgi:hypothetical protein